MENNLVSARCNKFLFTVVQDYRVHYFQITLSTLFAIRIPTNTASPPYPLSKAALDLHTTEVRKAESSKWRLLSALLR